VDPGVWGALAPEFQVALTLERWIAAAVAGCLIAVVLVSGDDSNAARRRRPQAAREVLDERANRTSSQAGRAADRLRRKVLLDSVMAVTARAPRSSATRLFIPDNYPKRAQLTRAVNARLAGLLPAKMAVNVDFVVPADTGREWRRDWNLHLLPTAGSNTCVAIAGNVLRSIRDWVGPCGFYAAFGSPGVNVDRWLKSGAWIYGVRFWSSIAPAQDLSNYYGWYDRSLLWRGQSGFPMRRFISTLAYACLAGKSDACGPPILTPQDNDQETDWYGGRPLQYRLRVEGSSVWAISNDYLYWGWLMGPSMRSLLSDMAVSLGPDRFRRFWTSPLPLEEAFRAAAGQDIRDWTAMWMRSTYGNYGIGPRVSAMAVFYALVIGLLAFGGAIVAAGRRQVA